MIDGFRKFNYKMSKNIFSKALEQLAKPKDSRRFVEKSRRFADWGGWSLLALLSKILVISQFSGLHDAWTCWWGNSSCFTKSHAGLG